MRRILTVFLWLALAPSAWAANAAHPEPKPNLTVLVDSNLMMSAAKLARAYATVSNTPLTMVVKNPAEAEDEIGQGLEAHLLLTANDALVERLTEQGLTDVSSTRVIATMPLALIASNSLERKELLAKHISFAAMIYATPDVPVFVEAPASDAGKRAAAMMQGYEFSAQLAARARVTASQWDMLDAMAREPGLGLILAADVASAADITLLSIVPETISPSTPCRVVVLASESMDDARQFAQFLTSPAAQKILAESGFHPAGKI